MEEKHKINIYQKLLVILVHGYGHYDLQVE